MTAESREELLSAYLDDELSADERASVEQWLDDSAEYRQLYEELRALRNDLRALPRHRLADDLGPAVLRRAERTVLSGPEHASDADRVESGSSSPWWLPGRSRRTFIWPVIAVAAALMVALFDARRDEQRDVAMDAPAAQEAAGENEAPSGPRREGRAAGARDADKGDTNKGDTNEIDAAMRDIDVRPAVSEAARRSGNASTPRLEKSAGAVELNAKEVAPRNREMLRRRSDVSDAPAPAQAAALGRALDERLEQKSIDALKMDTNVKRALQKREQVTFIQCDVSPDFISKNQLEKVLSGNKVAFRRYNVPTPADDKRGGAQLQLKVQPPGVQYTLQATPEQVEQIVIELEQEQGQRNLSNLTLGLLAPSAAAKSSATKSQSAKSQSDKASDLSRLYFMKQQPVMIYLRQMQPAQPAAPAEPERAAP